MEFSGRKFMRYYSKINTEFKTLALAPKPKPAGSKLFAN